jgi:hypothetical protein
MGRTGDSKAAAAPENAEGRSYRKVHVEELRRFVQDETELTSIRRVAAEVGIGRTTLHKFVAGETIPHPRVRRLLAIWYLRRLGYAVEDEEVLPEEDANSRDVSAHAGEDVLRVAERSGAPGTEPPPWFRAFHEFRGHGRASPPAEN